MEFDLTHRSSSKTTAAWLTALREEMTFFFLVELEKGSAQ